MQGAIFKSAAVSNIFCVDFADNIRAAQPGWGNNNLALRLAFRFPQFTPKLKIGGLKTCIDQMNFNRLTIFKTRGVSLKIETNQDQKFVKEQGIALMRAPNKIRQVITNLYFEESSCLSFVAHETFLNWQESLWVTIFGYSCAKLQIKSNEF